MRVLHSPCNVGNQPQALCQAERSLGVASQSIANYATWLGYKSDIIVGEYQDQSVLTLTKRWLYGLSAPYRYDVLHYYFGRSLMCWDDYGPRTDWWFWDLKQARRLGKKVVMTLQGCDARIASRSNEVNEITPCQEGMCRFYDGCVANVDNDRRYLIDEVLPLCDKVFYLNPELKRYVPEADFLPYATIDVQNTVLRPPKMGGPVRILHAPSDGATKGTRWVLMAVEELKKKYDIEFRMVENTPHAEALELYEWADILVDQLLFGWYGGLSVELMAMGKLVVCYIREDDLEFIPGNLRSDLPIIRTHRDSLTEDLSRLIEAREQWPTISKAMRNFALKWHDPTVIADAMIAMYRHPDTLFDLNASQRKFGF